MSEFGTNVLDLEKRLKNRKYELQKDEMDLSFKLNTISSEIKYIDKLLEEMKPLREFVYAEEYLDSLSENKIEEGN